MSQQLVEEHEILLC